MTKKLEKLEALRGFAAVYVVFSHLFDQSLYFFNINFAFLFKFGQEAVMIFFILSGFVIHYSFKTSRDKSFQTYFEKRFFRIYVPLIIVLLTSWILHYYFSEDTTNNIAKQFFGNLFMLQDLENVKPNVFFAPFLNNGPLWSLSYEWWFYMIYYLIQKYANGHEFKVVFIIVLSSTLSYLIFPFFINRVLIYLVIWWSGVEIATLYLNKISINTSKLKHLFGLLSLCAGILFINWLINYEIIQFSFYPFLEFRNITFTMIIILVAIGWKNSNWLFFNNTVGIFSFLAPISYVLYISHGFLVIKPDYLKTFNNKFAEFFIGFAICMLYSYLVEKKFYPFVLKTYRNHFHTK